MAVQSGSTGAFITTAPTRQHAASLAVPVATAAGEAAAIIVITVDVAVRVLIVATSVVGVLFVAAMVTSTIDETTSSIAPGSRQAPCTM
jgi:hypothetical protein